MKQGKGHLGRPKKYYNAPSYSEGAQQITIRLEPGLLEFVRVMGGAKYVRGLIAVELKKVKGRLENE